MTASSLRIVWSLLLLLLPTSAACGPNGADAGDGDADAGGDEDPDAEACEHMAGGPADAVTASASAAGAPSVSTEHTRFDVALIDDGTGSFSGSVAYEADDAADFLIYLDLDVPFAVFDAGATSLPIEASDAVDLCTEVAIRHTVELPVGVAELRFGPSAEGTVSLVVEAAGGHEE